MTNRFLCTILYFVKGTKPNDQMETSVGTRGSDSLLHSLSSGLWAPRFSLECPISFSPFLPFGTLGNTAGDGGVFLFIFYIYIKFIGLTSILTRILTGCFTDSNQCDTIGCKFALRGPATKKRIRYQFLI